MYCVYMIKISVFTKKGRLFICNYNFSSRHLGKRMLSNSAYVQSQLRAIWKLLEASRALSSIFPLFSLCTLRVVLKCSSKFKLQHLKTYLVTASFFFFCTAGPVIYLWCCYRFSHTYMAILLSIRYYPKRFSWFAMNIFLSGFCNSHNQRIRNVNELLRNTKSNLPDWRSRVQQHPRPILSRRGLKENDAYRGKNTDKKKNKDQPVYQSKSQVRVHIILIRK